MKKYWGFVCLAALALAACTPPKYVSYVSLQKDWRVAVPWGWEVITDADGRSYTNVNFIGPFESVFYLGAPSFSVRWYSNYVPHVLRTGQFERYDSPEDYITQMTRDVYGHHAQMIQDVHDIQLPCGLKAKHFIILSPGPVAFNAQWGVAVDAAGKKANLRQHAYVLVPMPGGFYVLIYPATRAGFPLYEPQFNELVNSFTPLTAGPGGPAAATQAPSKRHWPFH